MECFAMWLEDLVWYKAVIHFILLGFHYGEV